MEHLEPFKTELDALPTEDSFVDSAYELAETWRKRGVGVECVEAVLRYMEEHPDTHYGAPGPLVHFVESFLGRGYEQLLLDSVTRRPCRPTLGMLAALINGTPNDEGRRELVRVLSSAIRTAELDTNTVEECREFLAAEGYSGRAPNPSLQRP